MKKKIITFLFIISSVFSLTSCQDKKEKIIIEREENISNLIQLSGSEFNNFLTYQRSFILFYGDTGCKCSTDFKNILRKITAEKEVRIYEMTNTEYFRTSFSGSHPTYQAGLLLFKDGILKYYFDTYSKWKKETDSSNKDSSVQSVQQYLEKYCFFDSPFFEIDKDKALEKIESNEVVYIYYLRRKCPDCMSFHQLFLNQWILRGQYDKTKKIYNFDLDPYREKDEASYKEIKNTFLLSKSSNPKLGYKEGVVPTIQKYENGQLSKMAVIYNDDENPEDSNYYTIIDGYYKDAPFMNQRFEDYSDYKKQTTSFYQEKFLEVIDEKK